MFYDIFRRVRLRYPKYSRKSNRKSNRKSRRKPRRKSSKKSRRDYLARKEAARELVIERLAYFVAEYARFDVEHVTIHAQSMKYNRLAIRNTHSRWGSCSSRKNLNFNYRLLDLSPELRDYVIVHELCHLKELHHGRAFWDLMKLVIPRAHELHRKARMMRIG